MDDFEKAKLLIDKKLKSIRKQVPCGRNFDPEKVAEVEINKFILNNHEVDRIMVVLRSTGCSHYRTGYGCSMCAHLNGTLDKPVTTNQYVTQWENLISGKSLDKKYRKNFDLNKYKILCLYNLGSLLNPKEISFEAVRKIFSSLAGFKGIEKVIIESRAEYVTCEALQNIKEVYSGMVEVGMGLESSNKVIRELCHHKNMPDLAVFNKAIKTLHKFNFQALAYVNQKPIFLTEREAIKDAVETTLYAFKHGVDAVSIEPTSLQHYSLTDYLYNIGLYNVPWLWSVREVVKHVYKKMDKVKFDLRIGGYFDEEILSGSQGCSPGFTKNEIFPYQTSGNCSHCSRELIDSIKNFNKNQKLTTLYKTRSCPYCYDVWENLLKVRDSRQITTRIIDSLDNGNSRITL